MYSIVHTYYEDSGCKIKAKKKKKALKPEWVWICLSDGKEVTSVNVGYSYLGVNVPQCKSNKSSQTFVLFVWSFSLLPSPAFKQSLFKIPQATGLFTYHLFCFKVHLE